MLCPHCGGNLFHKSADGEKLKAKTSMLILHKGGAVEVNCGICKRGVLLPLVIREGPVELRKAVFTARKT
jgi:hypothetical protein